MKRSTMLIGLAVLLLTPVVLADVPKLINFQGILRDGSGNPVADGAYTVRFRIYDDSTTAEANFLWTETVPVQTLGGLFNVRLGDDTPLPNTLFTGSNRFVGVKVNVDAEMPRVRLISVPYALHSLRSDSATTATVALDLTCTGCVVGGVSGTILDGSITIEDLGTNSVAADEIAAGAVGTSEIDATQVQRRVTGTAPPNEYITAINQDGSVVTASDQGSGGPFLPLAGGTMTGPITNTGNPAITMGKGNFGSGNSNPGVSAFEAGENDTANADYSTVAGGFQNIAGDSGAAVGGGRRNKARGLYSVVSGGGGADPADSNSASGFGAAIGGGKRNVASGGLSKIGGGALNVASQVYAVVAGGLRDTASGANSFVGGGNNNAAGGNYSVVAGGQNNKARGTFSFVGGGGGTLAADSNSALGLASTVGGGSRNVASFTNATVGGGTGNLASGSRATVGGGESDTASGTHSTVPGGFANKAAGNYSFAAGRRAKAVHSGAFVWGDGTDADFASTASNQFLIRASNVGIGLNNPTKKLEVAGSIKVGTNDTVFSSNISSNSPLSLQAPAGTTRMHIDDASGNVGIGTASPTTALEVTGQVSASSALPTAPAYSFAGDLNTGIYGFSDFLFFSTGGTQQGYIAPDGRFVMESRAQIGTTAAFGAPSTLYVQGSIATGITTVVGLTTLTASHSVVLVNTGATTITLPGAAFAPGRQYTIKKISAAAGIVTVDGAGAETIDGAATHSLTIQYEYVTIVSDGTSWFVVADN